MAAVSSLNVADNNVCEQGPPRTRKSESFLSTTVGRMYDLTNVCPSSFKVQIYCKAFEYRLLLHILPLVAFWIASPMQTQLLFQIREREREQRNKNKIYDCFSISYSGTSARPVCNFSAMNCGWDPFPTIGAQFISKSQFMRFDVLKLTAKLDINLNNMFGR